MKWLRTKFIDTHYPDQRNGEAHTRGMRRLLGLRSDGQVYVAHHFAEMCNRETLREHLDTFLDVPAEFPIVAGSEDDFKGAAGWVEEPE